MTRDLSVAYRNSAAAQETSAVPLVLLTISHVELGEPTRLCNNGEDIVSRGNTYVGFPFEITLPDETDGQAPVAKLRVSTVDRRVIQAVRQISSAPTVTIEVVLASQPDVVEASFPELQLTMTPWDSFTITGDLEIDTLAHERYPYLTFTPSTAPGVF